MPVNLNKEAVFFMLDNLSKRRFGFCPLILVIRAWPLFLLIRIKGDVVSMPLNLSKRRRGPCACQSELKGPSCLYVSISVKVGVASVPVPVNLN